MIKNTWLWSVLDLTLHVVGFSERAHSLRPRYHTRLAKSTRWFCAEVSSHDLSPAAQTGNFCQRRTDSRAPRVPRVGTLPTKAQKKFRQKGRL